MIIYAFKNKVNNKIYVGQTCRTFEERMGERLRHKNTTLGRALEKYGVDNFEYGIVDEAETIEELNEKEIFWIKKLNSMAPNGYNLCEGGDNTLGYFHREESKKKMSLSRKGSFKGEENPFFGKKHTSETRKRMREAWTEERKDQLRLMVKTRKQHTVKVRNVDTGEVFESVKKAAEKYNLKDTHISRVCKGKRNRTGGFKWEYI